MHKDVKKVLFSEEEIAQRCKELGKQISADYEGKNPLFVALLRGSVPFFAELIKRIETDCEYDFMVVSSYEGTESQGNIKIVMDLSKSIVGKDIILVEDIVDTGKTLDRVRKMMFDKGANSVKIVTLLDKKERRTVEIEADYVGFKCPNEFVIGYGLDFNQKYRNLPFVGVLKEECYM